MCIRDSSSIFVASALVAYLKEREPEYEQIAARVANKNKGGDKGGTREVSAEDATFGEQATRQRARSSATTAPPRPTKSKKAAGASTAKGTTVPPRPRKTKKKK